MKRLTVSLLMALVFLIATVAPVSAQGVDYPGGIRFHVEAPNSAYQGEVVHVVVHVQNLSNKPALLRSVAIHFPKSLVASVSVTDGPGTVVDRSTESEFILQWKVTGVFYPRTSRDLYLDVVLKKDASVGMNPFVEVLGPRGVQLEYRDMTVMASAASLRVTLSAPDVVSRDGVIFFIDVTLANETSLVLPYDMETTIFYAGTDKSVEYSYTGGEVYRLGGDSLGMTLSWRGKVQPGESVTLTIKTASGSYPGTYELVGLDDLLSSSDLYAVKLVVII